MTISQARRYFLLKGCRVLRDLVRLFANTVTYLAKIDAKRLLPRPDRIRHPHSEREY
jgi:hypothetical protein